MIGGIFRASAEAARLAVTRERQARRAPIKAEAEVLVVGAGAAGVAAARELSAHHSVRVIEAADHVGGRVSSARVGDAYLERGANWIHDSEGHPLTALMEEQGAAMFPTGHDQLFIGDRQATPEERTRFQALLDSMYGFFQRNFDAGLDFAEERFFDETCHEDSLAPYLKRYLGSLESGAEVSDVSSKDASIFDYERTDLVVKGFGDHIARLAEPLDVDLSTRVRMVRWRPSGVLVVTEAPLGAAAHYRGKAAILTVSTGVLNSGAIEFDPPLPRHVRLDLAKLPMSTFNKLIFVFDSNVTDKIPDNTWVDHAARPGDPNEMNAALLIRPGGQNAAIVFAGGKHGRMLEEQGQAAAREYGLKVLCDVFGPEVADHVVQFEATEWNKDPNTRGSYSYAKPGAGDVREKLKEPFESVVLAGEAISDSDRCATVAGAWDSGLRAAGEVERWLEQRKQLPRPRRAAQELASEARAIRQDLWRDYLRNLTGQDSQDFFTPAAPG